MPRVRRMFRSSSTTRMVDAAVPSACPDLGAGASASMTLFFAQELQELARGHREGALRVLAEHASKRRDGLLAIAHLQVRFAEQRHGLRLEPGRLIAIERVFDPGDGRGKLILAQVE